MARRTIRLFTDEGHDWPLWEVGDKYLMEPVDYGLSDALTARLRAWHDEWQSAISYDPWPPHWTGDRPAVEWEDEGEEIAATLAREVAEFADVKYVRGFY